MKNNFKKFTLLLLSIFGLLFSIEVANANSIYLQSDQRLVNILEWNERDIINDLNLNVSLLLQLKIQKTINPIEIISILFSPGEFTGSDKHPAKNFNVELCKNRECSNKLNSALKISPSVRYLDFKDYQINISQKDLEWKKFRKDKIVYLKIEYQIPSFIKNRQLLPFIPLTLDTDKTVIIGTGCIPTNNCPTPKNVFKEVILPKNIVLRTYDPKGTILHGGDGSLGISWRDFATSNPDYNYETIVIQYTDINAERNLFFGGLILGLMGSLILSGILTRYYYNKSKNNNKLITKNMNKKLNLLIKKKK